MTDMLDKATFQSELEKIASSAGRPIADVRAEALADLTEMRSIRKPLAMWLFAALGRFIYRRGYKRHPVYDLDEVERVRAECRERSTVFLVTHKTYLDFFVLFDFLYRHDISPPFIFGGLNMTFAGFGTLARRAGGIFIRRSFKDDAVYKAVLKRYIEALIEEGSSFMWAIEGTRSRTGKLLVPRLGLLNYVGDVSQNLNKAAISYIPVSVVYDQIPDVVDMAAQEAGADKKPESLPWFMEYVRGLGGSFGNIHIRFGDAMAITETPDAPDLESASTLISERQIEIQKLAFEVCYRINEITPATVTSLVLMVLLCRGPCEEGQIRTDVAALNEYIRLSASRANSPRPNRKLKADSGESIDALIATGVLQSTDNDNKRVLAIAPDSVSVAIYYSNMAVHHFVISAFTELALIKCLGSPDPSKPESIWAECLRLRNLFKFEFFFSRNDVFRDQLRRELDFLDPQWRTALGQGREAILSILKRKPLLVAAGVLSPFVAAYRLLGKEISINPASRSLSNDALIARCQAVARQPESDYRAGAIPGISRALLANGIRVADNRGLRNREDLDEAADGDRKRDAFLQELALTAEALVSLNQIAHSQVGVEQS